MFGRTDNPPVSIPILTAFACDQPLLQISPIDTRGTHASGRRTALERRRRGLEEAAS